MMRTFLGFFGASAAGLAIDLVGFAGLSVLGLEPWAANGISSAISVTAVYLVATRHAFGVAPKWWTYALFFTWYACSIIAFSTAIQFASHATDTEPFLWKLASIPVSFALNFAFSTVLFRKPRPGSTHGATEVSLDE